MMFALKSQFCSTHPRLGKSLAFTRTVGSARPPRVHPAISKTLSTVVPSSRVMIFFGSAVNVQSRLATPSFIWHMQPSSTQYPTIFPNCSAATSASVFSRAASGSVERISASSVFRPVSRPKMWKKSVMSPFSGRPGQAEAISRIRTLFATPCSESATLRACSAPGWSLSGTMATSAPASCSLCSGRHLPAPIGEVVAVIPSAAMLSASFSPSTTRIIRPAAMAFLTSGSRYTTGLTPLIDQRYPPLAVGSFTRCRKSFGMNRTTSNSSFPFSSV